MVISSKYEVDSSKLASWGGWNEMEPTTPNAQLNGGFRYAAPTLPTLIAEG